MTNVVSIEVMETPDVDGFPAETGMRFDGCLEGRIIRQQLRSDLTAIVEPVEELTLVGLEWENEGEQILAVTNHAVRPLGQTLARWRDTEAQDREKLSIDLARVYFDVVEGYGSPIAPVDTTIDEKGCAEP